MSAYLSKISSFFTIFSSDMTFILSGLFIFWAASLYFGRSKIASFILSFYPATFLFKNFPFTDKLVLLSGEKMIALNKLGIFLLFFMPIYIIINRYVFSASEYTGASHMIRGGGLALASLIMIMLLFYTTLDLSVFHDFEPKIDGFFTNGDRVFYWNLAVIVILAFF